jgi:hypothetical protein
LQQTAAAFRLLQEFWFSARPPLLNFIVRVKTPSAIRFSLSMPASQHPFAAAEFQPVSIYGYLNCHDCRHTLWLGKALHCNHRPFAFHIGEAAEPPHWARRQLNQALWKFLADHSSHRIDVRLEHEMTDEMFSYRQIGGDSANDISFEAYLTGWPGLEIGDSEGLAGGDWREMP